MTNRELIAEYIRGERRYGAANHLGYSDGKLINYSTEICRIDREKRVATVNSRKYSTSTSKIQSQLRYQLVQAGYTIVEYEGEPCYYWNAGYMGAERLSTKDMK